MIFEDGYFGYYAPKNELERRFKVWWSEEGHLKIPPIKPIKHSKIIKELLKAKLGLMVLMCKKSYWPNQK